MDEPPERTPWTGREGIRRNALIADLLHRIEFIEKAGTGIRRMRGEAREQGCPEPEFEETGFFATVFRPNPEVRAQAASQSGTQEGWEVTTEVRLLRALLKRMGET